jgi:hypothetical protein
MSGQLHMPAGFSPAKEPLYPLDRRLGGSQSWSGHGSEENKSLSLPRIETYMSILRQYEAVN